MISAVHTRRIVDPIVGGKVTGSLGHTTFGVLTAVDQAAGRDLEAGDPLDGHDKVFTIGRAQTTFFSPGSFAGAIVSTTVQGPASNTVAGADLSLHKRGSSLQMTGMALYSTATAADGRHTQGLATLWTGGMSSRRYDLSGQVEHYDRDFQMDSAFYNRTGFTSGWGFGAYSFYPSAKSRFAFVKRVVPFVFWQGGQDRVQDGSDNLAVPGIRIHMARQGFFRADYVGGHEPWVGQQIQARPLARLRQRPVLPLAARRRQRQRRLRHLLRRDRSVPGPLAQPVGVRDDPAELAPVRADRVAVRRLQPRRHRRRRLRRDDHQFAHDLPVHAPAVCAADRAARHLVAAAAARLAGLVRAASGHGVLRRLRRAARAPHLSGMASGRLDELSPLRESRRGLFLKASYLYRF